MIALFFRDLKLSVRAGGGAMIGVLFFMTVVAVIPFGVGPDLNLLARIGPAILWIGALLASLLGLDRLFQAEREDGSLDLIMMQETPLLLAVLVKCALIGPPPACAGDRLALSRPVHEHGRRRHRGHHGHPARGNAGDNLHRAVGAAVAVALPRGGLLVSILVLPLAIPVLIFGVSAVYAAIEDPAPFLPPFMILMAITLFFAVIGPVAAAAALRHSAD